VFPGDDENSTPGYKGRSLISIVEDDPSVRVSMQRLMRSLGYPVEAYESAADFVASPGLDATCCLIADIQMPGMNGIELHKHLTSAGRSIPTILVTAYPDAFALVAPTETGFLRCLRKPINEAELLRCVELALNQHRSSKGDP
jgi:FixJ family two-component response regulator